MTGRLPTVSVVVPARNAAGSIGDCVRSLLALDYPSERLELVVVNNGSSDETRSVLETFGSAIRIVDEPRPGRSHARNAGIRASSGEIVAFTDADCTAERGWLTGLVRPLRDRGVGVAGGPILSRRPATPIELFGQWIHDHRRALLELQPPYAITMSWASRRAVLDEVGLFDPGFPRCEDVELAYRIGERGFAFAFAPDAVVHHRNERTVRGLWREGFLHGYFAVPVLRRHAGYVSLCRARSAAADAPGPAERPHSVRFERVFASGKWAGRVAGRCRVARSRQAPAAPGLGRVAGALRLVVLRSERTALRPLWRLVHAAALRVTLRVLRARGTEAAVYLKGSFAFDEPVYGLSDIDVIAVVPDNRTEPGANRVALKQRWARVGRLLPPLGLLMQHFWVYEESELRRVAAETRYTERLTAAPGPMHDDMGLLDHPPLSGASRDWRLVAGIDRRTPDRLPDTQTRRLTGWLELQFLWRLAYHATARPGAAHVRYLCVKLLADTTRVWLWITRAEHVPRRRDALTRGLALLPAEEEALREALRLQREPNRPPGDALDRLLPAFVRLTSLIAAEIGAGIADDGFTDVRLVAGDERELALVASARPRVQRMLPDVSSPRLNPLVDWRSLASRSLPDEAFVLFPGDPDNLKPIKRAADEMVAGLHPALRTDGLLLFPARMLDELRTAQCEATDPVSFAVADGRTTARFPRVRGWSARDWAVSSVAEHGAWLAARPQLPDPRPDCESMLEQLGRLLTAARAALFLESLDEGAPELALPVAAVAATLGARGHDPAGVAEEAVAAYRDGRERRASIRGQRVEALAPLVRALPAYRQV
jgi:GT2 family glycosyltransferase/predicted nucleotidyltransferase